MKNTITAIVIILLASNIAVGQVQTDVYLPSYDTAYKSHNDSTGEYLIRYIYSSSGAFIPATWPLGEPHYYSKISVYKIARCKCFFNPIDTLLLIDGLRGIYVMSGCFEDSPAEYVRFAIKSEMNKEDD